MKNTGKNILLISLITITIFSCQKKSNIENQDSADKYETYFNLVENNVSKLSVERKKQREKWIIELRKNPVYKSLVDSAEVSINYLPVLNAINDAIKNSTIVDGKSQFGIEENIANQVEKSEDGENKMNFVVVVSCLSSQMNGGLPKEIIDVFERYRQKFNLYSLANTSAYNTSGKAIKIENSYNLSYAFGLFDPKDEKVLDAIYESTQNGISQWNGDKELIYENSFMALKSDYMKHLKEVYPDSAYLIDVDFEISASELTQEYKENEVAADEKYKSKKIAVSGTIGSIGKDVLDNPYISFKGEFLQGVTCYFSEENNKIISKLNKGDEIIIIGECRGLTLTNVVIKDCKIY